jgi:thioredoxin reductase (NADPH)
VENFPGFPSGILGPELMEKFREQSLRFGTKIITETVSKIDLSQRPFRYWREGRETEDPETADTVILATGASAKRLALKGEETYWQSGISACAVCDGAVPIFRQVFILPTRGSFQLTTVIVPNRNKPLAVIGGGDSAAEEATCKQQEFCLHYRAGAQHRFSFSPNTIIDLTKYGAHVYVLVRRGELRASKIMAKRLLNNPKIVRSVVWFTYYGCLRSAKSRLSFGTRLPSNVKATVIYLITFVSRTYRPERRRISKSAVSFTLLVSATPISCALITVLGVLF